MATQRWKRGSHIFCDRLLLIYIFFFPCSKITIKIKQGDLSFPVSLFSIFRPPVCLGAPIGFFFCRESYSLFLFCFASFLSIRKQQDNTFFDWFRRRKGRHERPTLCDVSVCVLLALLLSVHRFERGKGKWWKEELFSFPHFYVGLSRWWPSVAPAVEENVKSVNFFFRFPTNAHLSRDWHLVVARRRSQASIKTRKEIPFFTYHPTTVYSTLTCPVFLCARMTLRFNLSGLDRSFVATQLLPIIAVMLVIISAAAEEGLIRQREKGGGG